MKQIKMIHKKAESYVEIKCKSVQSLNRIEVQTILQSGNDLFLRFEIDEKESSFCLKYPTTGILTLTEFLKSSVLSKRLFLCLIRQILETEKWIDKNHLNRHLILHDIDWIFIDPDFCGVKMLYIPVQPFETTGSLRDSLQSILQYAVFDSGEESAYLDEFFSLVCRPTNFSVLHLEEYLEKMSSKEDSNNYFCANKSNSAPKAFFKKENEIINVSKSPFLIGKKAESVDMQIKDNTVSRKHAEIIFENGRFFLLDIGSTNGTFLNDKTLPINEKTEIRNGDKISFANQTYTFITED